MAAPGASLNSLINKYIAGNKNINIQAAAMKVYNVLISNINSSDIPGAAKSAILSAVSPPVVVSPTTAMINIGEVLRPSVYTTLGTGSKYGNVDLVLIFNERSSVKQTYYPIGQNSQGKMRWAKMTAGWTKPYSNHYLERTVSEGNALLAAYGGYVVMV